ncbi:MAG: CBS domain-containing protein [Gemmatimonadota bacterium]
MTPNPACCVPDDTAQDVATLMLDHDCGCIPIVEPSTRRVIGIITDRDVAVRGVARGRGPDTLVRELMTSVTNCCHEDDDLRDVERTMASNQVRRVPIVDSTGNCTGIIAQADIALAARRSPAVTDREVALVVERISEPNRKSATDRTVDAFEDPKEQF